MRGTVAAMGSYTSPLAACGGWWQCTGGFLQRRFGHRCGLLSSETRVIPSNLQNLFDHNAMQLYRIMGLH